MLLSYSTKTLEAVEFASLTNGRLEFYSAKIILFDLRLIFMYCSGPLRRTPSSLESFYKDDLSLLFISFDIYIYTISEKSSLNSCARYCNRGHWSRDKKKKSKKSIAVPRVCSDIILFPQSRVRRRQYCSYPGCKHVDNSIHIQDYGFQNVGLKEANTFKAICILKTIPSVCCNLTQQWQSIGINESGLRKQSWLVVCLRDIFMRCRCEILLILFLNIY